MNIALEQTEEHVNGAVTNKYGDAFIRGNNGAYCLFFLRWSVLRNTQSYTYRHASRYDSSVMRLCSAPICSTYCATNSEAAHTRLRRLTISFG